MTQTTQPSSLEEYLGSLPEFKSHDRVESLYSDYSSTRHSNPAGFHSNNATWQKILTDVLRYGLQPQRQDDQRDRLVLHLDDQLLEALRRPSIGKPYGLACPLWALSSLSTPSASSASLAPLHSFLSTGGWGPATGITSSMVRSISWASRALTKGTMLDPDHRFDQLELDQKLNIVKIDWVNLLLLRQAADQIIERYQQHFVGLSPGIECLYTRTQFEDQLTRDIFPSAQSHPKLTSTDLSILLKHLERDRRILTAEKNLIKFVLPSSIEAGREGTKYSSIGPAPINQVDRGVLSVKQTIQQLNQQIESLSAQIDQRTEEAKKCVKKAQPEMAAMQLKSRNGLKRVLSQRVGILETLNGVYMKIEQASTDVEIMKAYESSTKTLAGLLAAPTLQAERVSETMEALTEVLLDQQAVDGMINDVPVDAVDEQDIAAELAGLLEAASKPAPLPDPQPLPATTSVSPSIDDLQAQLARLNVPDLDPHLSEQQDPQPLQNQPLSS